MDACARLFGKAGLAQIRAVLRPHHLGADKQHEGRCWAIAAAARAVVRLDPERGREAVKPALAGCSTADELR